MDDEIFEDIDVYTLTDEDGKEEQFELLGVYEDNGVTYCALTPYVEDSSEAASDDQELEYVVLRREKDADGEDILVSIDDDDEFDRIADVFEDEFMNVEYADDPEE